MHKTWRIAVYLAIIFFTSCVRNITEQQLILLNGKYCQKGDTKPYTGKVHSYYPSGEFSGSITMTNGIPDSLFFVGFAGETIGGSYFKTIHVPSELDSTLIRVSLVRSFEGKGSRYFHVLIIVSKVPENIENNLWCEDAIIKVIKYIEKIGYFQKDMKEFYLEKGLVTVEVLLGELEDAYCQYKI